MPHGKGEQKPIGWYLRKADQRITDFFEEVFDKHCITRYHWMLLRTIDDKKQVNIKVYQPEVKHFVTPERLDGIVDNLAVRGWIKAIEKNEYIFTEAGKELFNKVAADYQLYLNQMMLGVTDEEYNKTVAVLDRIITNLSKK